MITIDDKYYLLEDSEISSGNKVTRQHDSKNVWRCKCPLCSSKRKKEHQKEKCVAVYPDDGWGFCYNCGKWFWTEAYYNKEIAPKRGRKQTDAKEKSVDLSLLRDDYPQELVDYFETERRLPMELVRRMGIKWIPRTIDGKEEIFIAYPTYDGAKCVNIHYRPLHKEKGFMQEAGCDPIPWNVNSVVGHTEMIITEGRNDAMACIQAGYEAVVSLGNGARSRVELFDGFRHTLFAQVKTVIIAVDNDNAGQEASNNLLKYFGAARCRVVNWGAYKDAIKFLSNHFFIVDANHCKGIDDILETARQIGLRYQTDMTVIDPANWIDQTQSKGGDPMERANYVIGQVVDFAQVENQLTWMVAHPRKPPLMRDGKAYVPEMWDIAGTSDYANKATWVEIMERDISQQRTMVHIKKVRFGHLGIVGDCCVRMDQENHRFVGFKENKTDAGNVINYEFLESDKSNWLVSKAVQQGINWE